MTVMVLASIAALSTVLVLFAVLALRSEVLRLRERLFKAEIKVAQSEGRINAIGAEQLAQIANLERLRRDDADRAYLSSHRAA